MGKSSREMTISRGWLALLGLCMVVGIARPQEVQDLNGDLEKAATTTKGLADAVGKLATSFKTAAVGAADQQAQGEKQITDLKKNVDEAKQKVQAAQDKSKHLTKEAEEAHKAAEEQK